LTLMAATDLELHGVRVVPLQDDDERRERRLGVRAHQADELGDDLLVLQVVRLQRLDHGGDRLALQALERLGHVHLVREALQRVHEAGDRGRGLVAHLAQGHRRALDDELVLVLQQRREDRQPGRAHLRERLHRLRVALGESLPP